MLGARGSGTRSCLYLFDQVQPRKPLREFGISDSEFHGFSEGVISGQTRLLNNNYVPLTIDDMVEFISPYINRERKLHEQIHKRINIFAAQIRKAALRSMNSFHGGHVGGSMSMSDLMAALYGECMKVDPKIRLGRARLAGRFQGPLRTGGVRYTRLMGYFPEDELETLNKEATRLPSHCDRNRTPGIDMTTGSLGQGSLVLLASPGDAV